MTETLDLSRFVRVAPQTCIRQSTPLEFTHWKTQIAHSMPAMKSERRAEYVDDPSMLSGLFSECRPRHRQHPTVTLTMTPSRCLTSTSLAHSRSLRQTQLNDCHGSRRKEGVRVSWKQVSLTINVDGQSALSMDSTDIFLDQAIYKTPRADTQTDKAVRSPARRGCELVLYHQLLPAQVMLRN